MQVPIIETGSKRENETAQWTEIESMYQKKAQNLDLYTIFVDVYLIVKWIWDRSISSRVKPSFDMPLFQYFWRFTQICKKFAAYERKIVFVIVFGSCGPKIVQKQ